jgi:hypothetical protein
MTTIITKICTKCKIERNIDKFSKNKLKKSGFSDQCKLCQKDHYDKNRIEILHKKKEYSLNNNVLLAEKSKKYRQENKHSISERAREKRINNPKKIYEKQKKYRENNKQKVLKRNQEYRKNNLEKVNNYYNEYRLINAIKIKKQKQEYVKKRMEKDVVFSIRIKVKTLIGTALRKKGYIKTSRTHEILGCDYETFKNHIESQFKDGMTWENKSEWHYDHKIPIASAKTEQDVIRLNHYLNLQPLWAKENMSKGAKLPTPIEKNKIELSIAKEKGLKLTQQSIF